MRKWTLYGLVAALVLALLGTGTWTRTPVQVAEANAGTQWNASYYNNNSLSGSPVLTRIDDSINFDWGNGSPDAAVPADNFSARWTKTVNFPTSGSWHFKIDVDDNARMWVDVTLIIDAWDKAPGVYEVDLGALTAGNHDLKVEYREITSTAKISVGWWPTGSTPAVGSSSTPANWTGTYFNNASLTGSPVVTRSDGKIDFDWGNGSPDAAVPADNFSARWTATVNFPTSGNWHFKIDVDDNARMWVDVTLIIDAWDKPPGVYEVDLGGLTAGDHALKVEYRELTSTAKIQVAWWAGGATAATTTTAPEAPPAPPPVKPIWAAVVAGRLNVRSGPGLTYPVITTVVFEQNFHVLGALPDMTWVKIDLKNGQSGWVSNLWVWLFSDEEDFETKIPLIEPATAAADAAAVAAAVPETTPPQVTIRGRAVNGLNVRDGASYFAKYIAGIPQNAEFIIEARNPNGAWYLVTYQGLRGWVYSPAVLLLEGTVQDMPISYEVVPAPPVGSVFVPETTAGELKTVRGSLNTELKLRDAASLRGKELGKVPAGTELVIEARNTNGAWYLVTYEGTQGWINAAYVTLIEGTVPDLPIR